MKLRASLQQVVTAREEERSSTKRKVGGSIPDYPQSKTLEPKLSLTAIKVWYMAALCECEESATVYKYSN